MMRKKIRRRKNRFLTLTSVSPLRRSSGSRANVVGERFLHENIHACVCAWVHASVSLVVMWSRVHGPCLGAESPNLVLLRNTVRRQEAQLAEYKKRLNVSARACVHVRILDSEVDTETASKIP